MNGCVNLRIRSKKGEKYCFCVRRKATVERKECFSCSYREFKKASKIAVKTRLRARAKKQSERTKQVSISQKVKKIVYERDNGLCIFCHKPGLPESHFIKRSHNGLGIEENIFTACRTCHNKFDDGKEREDMLPQAEAHLKSKYKDWNEESLIYHKYKY